MRVRMASMTYKVVQWYSSIFPFRAASHCVTEQIGSEGEPSFRRDDVVSAGNTDYSGI